MLRGRGLAFERAAGEEAGGFSYQCNDWKSSASAGRLLNGGREGGRGGGEVLVFLHERNQCEGYYGVL